MAYTTIKTTEEEKKKKQQAAAINGTNQTTKQTTTAATPKTATKSTNQYAQYDYDANTNQDYLDHLAKLQTAQQNRPTYAATYDDQLHSLYDQIVNRDKFRYDAAADPLWQNYLEQYTTKGKMAMMDSMGQAAALTGGYGSSYGQQVGQQTYQGYLQEANQAIPEFYGMALDAYTREGDAMAQQYGMLGDLKADEYSRYMDDMNQYWQEVNYQQGLADQAYDRGYNEYLQSQQMGYAREQDAYQKQQDAYDKLSSLIAAGYSPTAEDLAASGMTKAQADALARYYAGLNTGSGGGGSGGSGGGSKKKTTTSKTYSNLNTNLAKIVSDQGNKNSVTGQVYKNLETAYNSGRISADQYNSLAAQYVPKATAEDNARQNNGKPAVDVSTQVTLMRKKGSSQGEINNYLKAAVSAGVITQKEADKLKSAR
jgi:hypothetical protein